MNHGKKPPNTVSRKITGIMHPNPGKVRRGRGGGTAGLGDGVRTPFGQSGSLHSLKLVPSKQRCLVPGERRDGAQSRPPAGIPLGKITLGDNDASRWADSRKVAWQRFFSSISPRTDM